MCCNRVAGFLRRLNGFAATSGWFYRSTVDDARRPLVPPDRPGRRRACARGVPRPAPPVPLLCPLTGPDNAGPAPVVCPGPRPQCRCSADGPARLVAGLLRRGAPPPPLRGDGSTGVAVLAAVGVWWGGAVPPCAGVLLLRFALRPGRPGSLRALFPGGRASGQTSAAPRLSGSAPSPARLASAGRPFGPPSPGKAGRSWPSGLGRWPLRPPACALRLPCSLRSRLSASPVCLCPPPPLSSVVVPPSPRPLSLAASLRSSGSRAPGPSAPPAPLRWGGLPLARGALPPQRRAPGRLQSSSPCRHFAGRCPATPAGPALHPFTPQFPRVTPRPPPQPSAAGATPALAWPSVVLRAVSGAHSTAHPLAVWWRQTPAAITPRQSLGPQAVALHARRKGEKTAPRLPCNATARYQKQKTSIPTPAAGRDTLAPDGGATPAGLRGSIPPGYGSETPRYAARHCLRRHITNGRAGLQKSPVDGSVNTRPLQLLGSGRDDQAAPPVDNSPRHAACYQ